MISFFLPLTPFSRRCLKGTCITFLILGVIFTWTRINAENSGKLKLIRDLIKESKRHTEMEIQTDSLAELQNKLNLRDPLAFPFDKNEVKILGGSEIVFKNSPTYIYFALNTGELPGLIHTVIQISSKDQIKNYSRILSNVWIDGYSVNLIKQDNRIIAKLYALEERRQLAAKLQTGPFSWFW